MVGRIAVGFGAALTRLDFATLPRAAWIAFTVRASAQLANATCRPRVRRRPVPDTTSACVSVVANPPTRVPTLASAKLC